MEPATHSTPTIKMSICRDPDGVIGVNGGLPWAQGDLPGELRRYRGLTSGTHGGTSVCIVGLRTWHTLPMAARVITHDRNYVVVKRGETPHEAIHRATAIGASDIWIIGGAATYEAFMPFVEVVFETVTSTSVVTPPDAIVTRIRMRPWHSWPLARSAAHSSGAYTKNVWVKPVEFDASVDHLHLGVPTAGVGEGGYTRLVEYVLKKGACMPNRTGVHAKAVIDAVIKWDLRDGAMPLLTTKSIAWDTNVRNELVWFLSGSTDATKLAALGCPIWNANAKEAAARLGYPEGVLGPVYGHQWRRHGAPYDPATVVDARKVAGLAAEHLGSSTAGVDQIQELVMGIMAAPESRRHVVDAWNPADLAASALPPCHHCFQVHVVGKKMVMSVRMRSADLGLGVPYNLASYGMLAHALGILTGYTAVGLTLSMSNAHVYTNHVGALWEQVSRRVCTRGSTPKFHCGSRVMEVDDMRRRVLSGDLPAADALVAIINTMVVINYEPQANLRMEMAV